MTFLLGAESVTPLPCWDASCVGMSRTVRWNRKAEPCVWVRGLCMFLPNVYPGGVLWRRLHSGQNSGYAEEANIVIYGSLLQYSCLESPVEREEPGRLKSTGSQSPDLLRRLSTHARELPMYGKFFGVCTLIDVMANQVQPLEWSLGILSGSVCLVLEILALPWLPLPTLWLSTSWAADARDFAEWPRAAAQLPSLSLF